MFRVELIELLTRKIAMCKQLYLIPFLLVSLTSHAATEGASSFWSGDVEVGAVFTSGNTEQSNFKLRTDIAREEGQGKHSFHADTYRAETDGDKTANKTYLFYRYDYSIDEKQRVFGRLAYENDEFSGFDTQVDATTGYNRTLFQEENWFLTAEAGIGARFTEFETGDDTTEALIRLAGFYEWNIGDNALFKQFVGFEIGEELTTTRSETSLETNIVGNLAMKLAINVKHNSDVLPGKDKTDTESTVTVVYRF
jgi:putative salt-induced outer membrane protein